MTCFELHLQINQRLQEVASFKRDKFLPDEIDLALNKAMFRLLEKGVDSKFQDNQINLGHVSALIKKNKVLEVINPASTDSVYEENVPSVYSIVPPDLYWLVNSRTEVVTDPNNCETAPTISASSLLEYTAVVPFPAANALTPYFAAVSVTATTGTLYTAPSAITAGFTSPNSQYVVVKNILDTLYPHSTIKVYWERYRDSYYKNSFIFVSSINFGTITISGTGLTPSTTTSTLTTYPSYNRGAILSLPSKLVEIESSKTSSQNQLYSSIRQNQFYDTRKVEPLISQTQDYFVIYTKESFIVSRFYIDYIRKPRTISLLLNQSCELADSTHPKVVDLAVEILRLDTKDQSYPATVQDTQLRTN